MEDKMKSQSIISDKAILANHKFVDKNITETLERI